MTNVERFHLSFGFAGMAFYYSKDNSPELRLLGFIMLVLVTLFAIEAI